MEWNVQPAETGLKLIEFIRRHLPSCSAKKIKRAIESNSCMVNGRVERFASSCVGAGDKISFSLIDEAIEKKCLASQGEVLFEDEYFLIGNKPAGISAEDYRLDKPTGALFPVHRLDKDTTGVFIFAKGRRELEFMIELFRQTNVEKIYLALVDGVFSKSSGRIENHLGVHHRYQGQVYWGSVPAPSGKAAKTEWSVEQQGAEAALLKCRPITGRTHQIRVHCAEIGHPILGDYQYGRIFQCSYRPKRQMLHALEVRFKHPFHNKLVVVKAPIPEDLQKAIRELL